MSWVSVKRTFVRGHGDSLRFRDGPLGATDLRSDIGRLLGRLRWSPRKKPRHESQRDCRQKNGHVSSPVSRSEDKVTRQEEEDKCHLN